jgi:outer membrane receptor protein involved in Fe transport
VLNKVTFRTAFIALWMMLSVGAYAMAEAARRVDIPAGELSVALLKLSKEYGAELVYRPEQIHGLKTRGVHGQFTTEQAVTQLLQGTPLQLRTDLSGAMLIAPPASASAQTHDAAPQASGALSQDTSDSSKEGKKNSSGEFRVAQMDQGGVGSKGVTGEGLTEIIVTAQRKSERLQDVPISVSAFTQQTMDQQGVRNIDDLARLSPGVTFQRNGLAAQANYNDEFSDINIRGIDSTGGTSTTGIYIDDTPIQGRHIGTGGINAFPALFDLDRVEVLRGPQGTLFGAGAEGGVVRFISPEPGLTHNSGYVRSELATTKNGDPSYEIGAAVGGPIIDEFLGFRVSASYRRDAGWVNRVGYTQMPNPTNPLEPTPVFNGVIEPNANWQQTVTLRGALAWAVNDRVTITPSVYYQELHINDTAAYWVGLSNPGAGQFYNGNSLPNSSTDPFILPAIKLDWNLDFARLTSNTSYFSRHQSGTSNFTNLAREVYASFGLLPSIYPQPGDAGASYYTDTQKNFYQEIRLASTDSSSRFLWNTGIYYSHLNEDVTENYFDPTLQPEILSYTTQLGSPYNLCAAPFPCPNGLIAYYPLNRVVDSQTALFGEASFKFSDALKATVGLRVSRVQFTGSESEGGANLGASIQSRTSGSETPVTPKFVLSLQPNPDNLYYASVAKGYRVGGTNTPVSTLCAGGLENFGLSSGQAPGTYSSDSLWSYEIGAKNLFFDHSLEINTSLFVIDWSNIQQSIYIASCGYSFIANLGKAQSRGGDVDVRFRPVANLTLGLTLAYTDARYTKSACAGTLEFTGVGLGCGGPAASPISAAPIESQGDRLLGAPWTVTASAEHTFGEWGGHEPYVRADYQFTAAQTGLLPYQDNRNASSDPTLPGLPQTNNLQLRAGFRWAGYDLSLFAQNVLDQHPTLVEFRDIASPPPGQNDYFARGERPRTVGITATYRY